MNTRGGSKKPKNADIFNSFANYGSSFDPFAFSLRIFPPPNLSAQAYVNNGSSSSNSSSSGRRDVYLQPGNVSSKVIKEMQEELKKMAEEERASRLGIRKPHVPATPGIEGSHATDETTSLLGDERTTSSFTNRR